MIFQPVQQRCCAEIFWRRLEYCRAGDKMRLTPGWWGRGSGTNNLCGTEVCPWPWPASPSPRLGPGGKWEDERTDKTCSKTLHSYCVDSFHLQCRGQDEDAPQHVETFRLPFLLGLLVRSKEVAMSLDSVAAQLSTASLSIIKLECLRGPEKPQGRLRIQGGPHLVFCLQSGIYTHQSSIKLG